MAEDSEIRTKILAAARAAVARQGKFTMREVCAETGLARGVVSRCFGGKEGLTAALVAEDLKSLSGIIASPPEHPMSLPQAVGENIFYIDAAATVAPAREPRIPRRGEIGRALEERQVKDVEGAMKAETEAGRAPDAWLERRLRVFERALNNIELREEKSGRERTDGLGALEEGLRQMREALAQGEAQSRAAALELRAQLDEMTLRIGTLEIAQMDRALVPQPLLPEPDFTPLSDPAPELAEEASEEKREEAPDSFIAQARRSAQAAQIAAQSTAQAEPANDDKKLRIRWFVIAAVVLILVFASATIAFAKLAQSDAARLIVVNGVAHRHLALLPAERLAALADGGDARARTLIAQDYLRGEGLPQNDVAAARWSLLAAAQGQPVAQYMLGTLYQQGAGLASDPHAAFRWFQAAALQGNRKAMHNLAIAYAQGQGVEKNPQESARWFARAAMLGYVDSQFDLAVLYERGEGVPQSLSDAYKWYAIAAAQGDAPSAERIEVLRTQLAPADIAAAARAAKAFTPEPFSAAANIVPGKI